VLLLAANRSRGARPQGAWRQGVRQTGRRGQLCAASRLSEAGATGLSEGAIFAPQRAAVKTSYGPCKERRCKAMAAAWPCCTHHDCVAGPGMPPSREVLTVERSAAPNTS
jgi:hypothetical protein